jgi:hypothetical protein
MINIPDTQYNAKKQIIAIMAKYCLTGQQVADFLKIKRDTIYNWRIGTRDFKETTEFILLHKIKKHYEERLRQIRLDISKCNAI